MDFIPSTRKEAKKLGLSYYYTGLPCKHGHVAKRHAASGTCIACQRKDFRQRYHRDPEAERKRARNYYKANKTAFVRKTLARKFAYAQATPAWTINCEWHDFVEAELYESAVDRAAATGIAWEVDHMLPLAAETVCGLHCADNLQLLPRALNRSKKNQLRFTERNDWLFLLDDPPV